MENEIFYKSSDDENFSNILNKYEFNKIPKKTFVYQDSRQLWLRNLISKNTIYESILLYHNVGVGKCSIIDTPIIMYDGSIKKVQDIKVGEYIMGDDSTPRKVLSLSTGNDEMYDVIPTIGEKYTVNKEHVLCLIASNYPRIDKSYAIHWIENNMFNKKKFNKLEDVNEFKDTIKCEQIIEITVKDYIKLSYKRRKELKGYKVSIEFGSKELPNDPYIMGYILGKESKLIPLLYKCNSRENRLKLLAGLIDSSSYKRKNSYNFYQPLENPLLLDDVIYLSRSLGYTCNFKSGSRSIIKIGGNNLSKIPTKRYKHIDKLFCKDALFTGISVKYVKNDKYYGFTLDGNCRYMMGDFTVTHNTCTSISIAEGFKEYINNMGRKVVILVKNDNIRQNFINELLSSCANNAYISTEMIEELKVASLERRQEIRNKFIRKINKTYSFITYGSFTNQVLGAKQNNSQIRSSKTLLNLNNTVIIIDEVHNVTNNDYYVALQTILTKSYNYRLVLLTATPLYDNPKEIVEISNLLNMNNPKLLLPIRNDVFKDFKGEPIMKRNMSNNLGLIKGNIISITDHGKKLLSESLLGKVSYLASNKESFPLKIDKGVPLTDKIGSINIIECKMSEYQSEIYKLSLEQDTNIFGNSDLSELANNLEKQDGNTSSSSLYHNSSGASTIVYPNNYYGKEGFLSCFEKYGTNKNKKTQYRIKSEYKFLLTNNLSKYSIKFKKILDNIKLLNDLPGNIFIYSNYVEYNGTELLRQLLINNGYFEFRNIDNVNSQKTFIVYDSSYSSEEREKLRKIYNSVENKDGNIIKIIIGSPIISEGITLKNTRQLHILEPSWNMSSINQIIGRAVRYNSHSDLDSQFRNVEIFKYTSLPISGPSIDQQKYILSEYKDRSNKTIERLLKQIALDCSFNSIDNNTPQSAECDYTNCDYKCLIKPQKNPIDKSTYNLFIEFFDKFDIEFITKTIKSLFKTYFVWSIDDIIENIKRAITKNTISDESIFISINHLIDNKTIITDQYNREGFLIQKDIYIIFNPIDKDINTSIFAKTLDFEVNVNKYSLSDFVQLKYKKDLSTVISKKESKKKITDVNISKEDILFNQQIIENNKLFGTIRDKGIKGNFGTIDNKFRIVDLRNNQENNDDKRKNLTGMSITSIKKPVLIEILDYLNITSEVIKKYTYIIYPGLVSIDTLNTKQLSSIIQKHLDRLNLILK